MKYSALKEHEMPDHTRDSDHSAPPLSVGKITRIGTKGDDRDVLPYRMRFLVLPLLALIFFGVALFVDHNLELRGVRDDPSSAKQVSAMVVTLPFDFTFGAEETILESGSMEESASPYWWLNSGGVFEIQNGVGRTLHGDLPVGSRWQVEYKIDNPIDSDNGLHPQNIFRLLTRTKWQDVRQEVFTKITRDQFSASPNRGESNGILLFSRYADEDDLYYAGIRVDGDAVIKKKARGNYFTLAEAPLFPGVYERNPGTSLIPHDEWLGIRLDTENLGRDAVRLTLYTDVHKTGGWTKILEVVDSGHIGGASLVGAGHVGIRADFMDVIFDNFHLESLAAK